MSDMTAYALLNGAAAICVAVSAWYYISTILRGETKPSRSSWFVWATLSLLSALAMGEGDSHNGQIVTAAMFDIIIFALALKFGKGGWSRTDRWCLLGAAVGLTAWLALSSTTVGLAIFLAVTLIGGIPTMRKTWKNPGEEDAAAWVFMILASLFQTIAIPAWEFDDVAQPLVWLLEASIMVFLILRPKLLRLTPKRARVLATDPHL